MDIDLLLERLPHFETCDEDSSEERRDKWYMWKRAFENVMTAIGEEDENRLKAFLVINGGSELRRIYTLLSPLTMETNEEDPGSADGPYKTTLKMFDNYFNPKRSMRFERNVFHYLRPYPNEKLSSFTHRLQTQARYCNFGSPEANHIAVIDKIIMNAPQHLKQALLEKDMTLHEMIMYVRLDEEKCAGI